MKNIIKSVILISALMSTNIYAESTFYSKIKEMGYIEVKIAGEESNEVNESVAEGMFSKISCGAMHCYGIRNNKLYVVGYNNKGQLGLGNNVNKSAWTYVNGMDNVSNVEAGDYFGYIVSNGELYGAGDNDYGQLGRSQEGGNVTINNWVIIEGMSGVTELAAGKSHSYAIKNGNLYSIGYNGYGQLGIGNKTPQSKWVVIPEMQGLSSVKSGDYSGYVIKSNKLYVVGHAENGQLGLGVGLVAISQWIEVPNFSNVTQVSSGDFNSYIIDSGKLYSTGHNAYGQLGLGDSVVRYIYTYVEGMDGVSKIKSGNYHTFTINDGKVYSAGYNVVGQLSRSGDTSIFKEVDNFNTPQYLVANGEMSFIIKDGRLYATGYNNYGQLGIGNTENQASFIEVDLSYLD